jgi:hypothetical protein
LTEIGAAVRKYCDQNGGIFLPSINDPKKRPLLSWRVELLPYLGLTELHKQFRLKEPWNSPHNQRLLARIPDVYLSPERFDEKTNYVVPLASFTAFSRPLGLAMRNFEDGPSDTVVLLEADDSAAVLWTQPADLKLDVNNLGEHIGRLRQDGFFVIWGDGSLTRVANECSPTDLKAIFSYDGGESFSSFLVRQEATAIPDFIPRKKADTASSPDAPDEPTEGKVEESVADGSRAPADRSADASRPSSEPERLPIPDPVKREECRKLVREIYHEEYEKRKTISDQKELAKRMLKEAGRMNEDPAGQFVMLDIVLKMTAQIGDTLTAVAAMEQLWSTFEVDQLAMLDEYLPQLAKKDRSNTGLRTLLDQARPQIHKALNAEQFDIAENLCEIALGAARQLGDRTTLNNLEQQSQLIDDARRAFESVRRTIAALDDADDPDANLEVGRYYCLMQGAWDKGLPLLAKGSDLRLKQLAEDELRNSMDPRDQLELADGWWKLGETDPPRQRVLRLRAAYWYSRALNVLPRGLWRTKAQMRLDEVKREYGPAALAAGRDHATR